MSATTQLLLLFVVMPLVVAPIVVLIVVRRSPTVPAGLHISDLLRDGAPAQAELLDWKKKATFLFDSRPMVAFHLSVRGDEPFELFVMQSTPTALLSALSKGMTVDVRVSADHTAGAIVWP